MEKVYVETEEQLKELENSSALTFEGTSGTDEGLVRIFDWIKEYTPLKRETAYIINGKTMNRVYGLTGDNAYPDFCNIVSVMLDDMEDFQKIIIPRFRVGGRWFDDIVDNNRRREEEKQACR